MHPPVTEFTPEGVPITPKALCYVQDWYTAFEILTAYKAGTYEPGMECKLNLSPYRDEAVESIIADYSRFRRVDKMPGITFSDVYHKWYTDKFERAKKEYSPSTIRAPKAAYLHCGSLYNKHFDKLTVDDLQAVIDNCSKKKSTLESIRGLFNGMYKYAVSHGITDKELSKYVTIRIPDDSKHGTPFTETDLLTIWDHRTERTAARILTMCMSGYRVSAFRSLEIHDDYFIGGNKTKAGKDNLVPIHNAIKPIIPFADLNKINPPVFRGQMLSFLSDINLPRHTPHDCKHTFSMLCDKYKVNPIARMKMLGHSINMSQDVYGHWTYDMLKPEIEKITIFY